VVAICCSRFSAKSSAFWPAHVLRISPFHMALRIKNQHFPTQLPPRDVSNENAIFCVRQQLNFYRQSTLIFIFKVAKRLRLLIALAYCGGPSSIPGQSMRDLWWIKRFWNNNFRFNIKAPMLHIILYFNNILRRTAGETWGPSNKAVFFQLSQSFELKCIFGFFNFQWVKYSFI
jgi:hypothetical protein